MVFSHLGPLTTGLLQNVHLLILYVCTSGYFYAEPGVARPAGYISSSFTSLRLLECWLRETTPGRPSLGLEKTGEPIRAPPPVFLSSLRVFHVL